MGKTFAVYTDTIMLSYPGPRIIASQWDETISRGSYKIFIFTNALLCSQVSSYYFQWKKNPKFFWLVVNLLTELAIGQSHDLQNLGLREYGSSGEDVSVNAVIIPKNWWAIPFEGQSPKEGYCSPILAIWPRTTVFTLLASENPHF